MFISDFAIRRPIITLVSMLALVIFGIAALLMLKTDEFPDVQPPVVAVSIVYPGGAPENVEREILEPVEDVKRRYDVETLEQAFFAATDPSLARELHLAAERAGMGAVVEPDAA